MSTKNENIKTPAALLLSGHKPEQKTSFSRQLRLLALFLNKRGVKTHLKGPGIGSTTDNGVVEQKDFENISELIRETGAAAAILLGYPDQFPFLHMENIPSIPFFLWAQFSRPPGPESIGTSIPVPLTEKTKTFLIDSDIRNTGPVIPHGADTSVFTQMQVKERNRRRNEWGLKNRFVIGAIGANTLRKQFKSIIETFARFYRQRQEGFLLIKTDRAVSIDGIDLQLLAKKSGAQKAVKIITDELTDHQLCRVYNMMDIYLNLSEWEGFCIPVIEAMACGIPVSAQPIQGPGEIIPYKDLIIPGSSVIREEGRVLYHADPDAASRLLLNASQNPLLLKNLSERGKREAGKRFDIRTVAAQWEKLILKINSPNKKTGTCKTNIESGEKN